MEKSLLFCDTETYSATPINYGTYRYAADAEVMIFTYAFGDGEVKVWDHSSDEEIPEELLSALEDPKYTKVFHNSMFDRNVIYHDWNIDIPVSQIHDTMVQALAHGLPGGLGPVGEALGIKEEEAKKKAGRQLINLFCKPRPKNMKLDRATRDSHPQEWQEFIDYAVADITAMRAIYNMLPKWNCEGFERKLWELDQKINDRGFKVDVDLAEKAIEVIKTTQARLSKEIKTNTKGVVDKASRRNMLFNYILLEHGVSLPDMQKSTLERRVNDQNLPDAVRELMAIRLEASTTSTSKYQRLVNAVSADDRLKGTLQFCGAMRTGRWAGRTFQPQNLPRPTHKQETIDMGIKALKAGCLELVSDDIMKLTSSMLRGVIIPRDGYQIVASDLSNIEGRVAAWVSGEEWKTQAFRDYDAGVGHDLYKLAYAKSFGVDPEDVDKEQRQLGKVQELALGYQGGVGAFITFAEVYRMDLEELARSSLIIPQYIRREAFGLWSWAERNNRTMGLSQDVYVVCDSLKRMWREAHPAIVTMWNELEDAATKAIFNKGVAFGCHSLTFRRDGAWLRLRLPSGRVLCYPSPQVENGNISYMGVNQYTRKWDRIKTYGGKFFENVCQSIARDVMADRMQAAEDAGYDILLTVHDELITEVPTALREDKLKCAGVDTSPGAVNKVYPYFCDEELSEILATPPEWALDLPLAAGGFSAPRYRKD